MNHRNPQQIVRVLVSEESEWFRDIIASLIHDLARINIILAMIVPKSIHEEDLFKRAAEAQFDITILFLNNILYSSIDRTAESLADTSANLVRTMVLLFKKPVIAFYGWPDLPNYEQRILAAGATAVFRSPFEVEDVQQAIKRCLPIW